MEISICHALFAIVLIFGFVLFWYGDDRKEWFHIFIKDVRDEGELSFLFLVSIAVILMMETGIFDVVIKLPNGYACSTHNVFSVLSGGYASGYIIYLLTGLIPKAKKKKSILSVFKTRLWNLKGEIECQMCGEDTCCKEKVEEYIKTFAMRKGYMNVYEIMPKNAEYLLAFMNSVASIMSTIMPYADYLDKEDLKLIEDTIKNATFHSEGLKDCNGKAAYPDDAQIKRLAESISIIYKNVDDFHRKLERIV